MLRLVPDESDLGTAARKPPEGIFEHCWTIFFAVSAVSMKRSQRECITIPLVRIRSWVAQTGW